MAPTWKKLAYEADVVTKALFDAYSILASDTDDTPAAVTLGASEMIGRKSAGGIVKLTAADILTIINVTAGATANAKATGAEIDTGTDDVKFATPTALKDSHNVPSVVPSTAGKLMRSDGTDWESSTSLPDHDHSGDAGDGATFDAANLTAGASTDGQILTSDGAGGAAWEDDAGAVKATGAEVDTGTDDAKFATPKALKDSHNVPSVVPGAANNLLVSDGTDWTSAVMPAHAISDHTVAVADIDMGHFSFDDLVIQEVADDAAVAAYAASVVGQILFSTDTLSAWLCTEATP